MSTFLSIRATSTSSEEDRKQRILILSAIQTLLVECGALVVAAHEDNGVNYSVLEVDVGEAAAEKLHIVEAALAPTERPEEMPEIKIDGVKEGT